MDIEGNEHRALLGAERSIFEGKVPYIALELNDKFLHERGSSMTEILRLLRDGGYMMSTQGFEGPFEKWDNLLCYPRKVNLDRGQPDYFFVHSSRLSPTQ